MGLEKLSEVCVYAGKLFRYQHVSPVLGNLNMKFAVFIPNKKNSSKIPSIYYLSGLTCTDENCSQKGTIGFKYAGELGLAMILPDTSPRGHPEIPGENDSYDFGTGAGFYLNATKEPFSTNYKMYDYVVSELPSVMKEAFDWYDESKISIMGHSMGGHGAITIALKNSTQYKSVSAFSPICNPINVPWGQKAFNGYLADPASEQLEYDSVELLKAGKKPPSPIYVDVGAADNFLVGDVNQLQPKALEETCKAQGVDLTLNYREGFDHSYYFCSSFFEDHVRFHGKYLS